VPTTRPRITLTETDDLARTLEAAARQWPEENGVRSRLVVRLALLGHRSLADKERIAAHRAAVDADDRGPY